MTRELKKKRRKKKEEEEIAVSIYNPFFSLFFSSFLFLSFFLGIMFFSPVPSTRGEELVSA